MSPTVGALGFLFLALASGPAQAQVACETLTALSFEDGRVTSAETIAAGAFTPPGARPGPIVYDVGTPRYDYLPEFCRVRAAFSGDLDVEIWLPAGGWNGDFVPVSGGVYGGRINRHAQLAGALMSGAATATGNNGNNGDPAAAPGASNAAYLKDHPEKIAAIGDALHRMVVRSKSVVGAYYGRSPSLTYMNERAARDPLLLIQRYPEDLDAVVLAGPIASPTRHVIWQMWVHAAANRSPEASLPPTLFPVLHEAVLERCDKLDGVADRVLEDPLRCDFDPASLLCGDGKVDRCLTAAQVETVRRLYAPVRDTRSGAIVFPGLAPGGELEWYEMAGPKPYPFAEHFFRHLAFRDPAWSPAARHVNFDTDIDLADAPSNRPLNADEPNIRRFLDRGGKLILIAGWNDQRIPAGAAIDYYKSVLSSVGDKARDGVRLFLVPGMMHYPLGGARPTDYSLPTTGLLKRWVGTGKAPDHFIATRYLNGREAGERLVCAFPTVAALRRPADVATEPANFHCVDR